MRDSVPSARYSPICNVLRQWKTSLIESTLYPVYTSDLERFWHGIRGSVNTIELRGTVLARHRLKRRAGTIPRSTGSQCKLKRYRTKGWACV